MRKAMVFFLMAMVVVWGCTSVPVPVPALATPVTPQPAIVVASAVSYTISGVSKRVAPVVSYLRSKGCQASGRKTSEVVGTLKGKPWPGVEVSSGAGSDVFIPVSNVAVAKGLCSDQVNLLDSLAAACVQQVTSVASATSDSCDERPFKGRVTIGALAEMGGPGDIIEVHYRPKKSKAYKAKRGRVGVDAVFQPKVWSNGKCMRLYSKTKLSELDLKELLHFGESLQKLDVTDRGGIHDTIAVYWVK